MKCRLCDRPTTPGTGKLCLDCTKALHRARASSPAVRKLSMSPPVQAKAMATMGPPLTLATTSVLAPGWRRYSAWAAAGLVAIGIVYFTQSGPDHRRARDAVVADMRRRRRWNDPSRCPGGFDAFGSTFVDGASGWHRISGCYPGTANEGRAQRSENIAVSRGRKNTSTCRYAVDEREPGSELFVSRPCVCERHGNEQIERAAQPETPQLLAHASVAPSASPPEGAQTFASAMEKCGKEAFLSRFICEQKMYMQYCEDKWEKDPRCMRKTASN